ncbi:GtrA family protein [Nocardioides seonyuensis]|uniref:GtrA family protein n=1 Tax=Nocardioides seonyuensis TaxID=2518371 RepID=A0A4P7IGY4_9ACTN|nr:GtrA family protein [Nocardioides seonyuensis]QBX56535.1 GtrA family protein [Nocardioides seonyuensis]
MRGLLDRVLERHRKNFVLLLRFGIVGATGVLVNLAVLVLVRRMGPDFDLAIAGIPLTDFNLRWYHVYSSVAFLAANVWNFQLNRTWTFRSSGAAGWRQEYLPFLTVGLMGQLIGLALLTLLLHPHSPMSLPSDLLDDSTGLRTRLYWAQLIVIVMVTPLSFVLNKLWTFAAVRTGHPDLADPTHEERLWHER